MAEDPSSDSETDPGDESDSDGADQPEQGLIQPGSVAVVPISKIEPLFPSFVVSGKDKVRLVVEVFGRQGSQNQSLGDGVEFVWTGDGRTLEATGWEIVYTAPEEPGIHSVVAALDASECMPEEAIEHDEACSAAFNVTVKAPRVVDDDVFVEEFVDPDGEIPTVISDSDGDQFEVFTPTDGGTFDGDDFSVTAEPGAVPNGEVVGVSISEGDAASNVGDTGGRYTLGGFWYAIDVVDATGASVADYGFNKPLRVCLPLPPELRSNVSGIVMLAIRPDGSVTMLTASVFIGEAGLKVCGALSFAPVKVAVGVIGTPPSVAIVEPTPAIREISVGAVSPSIGFAWMWIAFWAMVAIVGGMLAVRRLGVTQLVAIRDFAIGPMR